MHIRQIISLIPVTYHKEGIFITLSAVLQAILNMAGLTVLIPLIILILDPDKPELYPWLEGNRNLILASVIAFIILKNLLNIWLGNLQINYINKLYAYYSGKLYSNYYNQGLLFIKNRHSDQLTYNTNVVSYLFTHGVLLLTLSIAAELFLLLFIWCGIFWFSPVTAFYITLCLAPFVAIYLYQVRKNLKTYGEKEDKAKRSITTLVGDTFRGYADIKLNNAFTWFKKQFDNNIAQIAYCRKWINRAFYIPQAMIECYIAAGMILFIIVGGNSSETRLTLGILAVAVLRILPSIRSLITMAIQWKNNAFTIDIIKDIHLTATEQSEREEENISFQNQITVNRISFTFPEKDKLLFQDFTMHIHKGECLGIQGISGIGKTTLFNLLLGFYRPQKGEIQIDGIALTQVNCRDWQKRIAYVPQDIFIMDATLAANIAFGADEADDKQIMQAIEKSGLTPCVSSLAQGIQTRIGQNGSLLSGGERQRIGIARALYKKAEVLLFDEATSSLDSQTENNIIHTIGKLSEENNNMTIIIISHSQSTLSICSRIIDINKPTGAPITAHFER